jgi:hypothetical protein
MKTKIEEIINMCVFSYNTNIEKTLSNSPDWRGNPRLKKRDCNGKQENGLLITPKPFAP